MLLAEQSTSRRFFTLQKAATAICVQSGYQAWWFLLTWDQTTIQFVIKQLSKPSGRHPSPGSLALRQIPHQLPNGPNAWGQMPLVEKSGSHIHLPATNKKQSERGPLWQAPLRLGSGQARGSEGSERTPDQESELTCLRESYLIILYISPTFWLA